MNEQLGPYIAVLVAIWIASVGVPIPEDIALLGGGLSCYWGQAHIGFMIPVALFAVLSGDLFIFFLGHRWASSLLEHRLTRRLATPERVEALKRQFHNHQMKTIFVGRFLPGMRALVFLTAGAVKISVWRFLIANGSAALISVPAFILLGYLFGHSYDRVKEHVADAEHIIVFAAITVAAVWILWHTFAKSAKAREAKRLLSDNGRSKPSE